MGTLTSTGALYLGVCLIRSIHLRPLSFSIFVYSDYSQYYKTNLTPVAVPWETSVQLQSFVFDPS